MKKCPCKDCSDRHASCHADCDKYKSWRAEYDALKAEAQPKTNAEKNYVDYVCTISRRLKRLKIWK